MGSVDCRGVCGRDDRDYDRDRDHVRRGSAQHGHVLHAHGLRHDCGESGYDRRGNDHGRGGHDRMQSSPQDLQSVPVRLP